MKIYLVDLIKHKRAVISSVIVALLLISATVISFLIRDLLFPYVYASVTSDNYGRVVVIDAGHGGEDVGAVGIDGSYEKDLNLQVAIEIGSILSEQGYTVVYTRTEDKLLYNEEENIKGMRKIYDLKNRCKISNTYPDAIFVSIHMNTYGNSKYSGLQVYHKENSDSALLATKIQQSVKTNVQNENNRQVKPGDSMYVLRNTESESVLIECGFLSNAEECKKLSEKEYQKQLSFAIVYGIIEYDKIKSAQ